MKTGVAHLPLHGGQAPRWLFDRMVLLSREMTRAIVEEYGPEEMLTRLSDPHWFQAFGCVLGFDWHSSGVTTTTCGALKAAVSGREKELGIHICGGKGATSRKTPGELTQWGEKLGINPASYIYASRMSAKVDNTAVQDGYQLYHHTFLFTKSGSWGVVQQGMSDNTKYARRYHWLSHRVQDFVEEPHTGICAQTKTTTLDLTAKQSEQTRTLCAELSREKPEKTLKLLRHLHLPAGHPVAGEEFIENRLNRSLQKAYEHHPKDFESLLTVEGVGPKTIRALALMSELVYGAAPSYKDPARYSFAHGGKDGHPYPVDRAGYDRSIRILRESLEKAKVGRSERLAAFKRLSLIFS